MDKTSTEPMPDHYGISIFSANKYSEWKTVFLVFTPKPMYMPGSVKLLHIGKDTDNHLCYTAGVFPATAHPFIG